MDRYVSGSYADQVPDWHEGDAPHKATVIAAFVRELGWSAGSVCEVGCGSGAVLNGVCAALGAAGVGVDIAPEAVSRAQKYARNELLFVVGDVSSAPPSDLVLCVDVVEHVADDIGLVTSLATVSSHVILRIPLDVSALDAIRPHRMLAARSQWGHRHVYTVDLALALVADAGLVTVGYRFDRVPLVGAAKIGAISDKVRRLCYRFAPEATTRWLGGYSLLIACTPQDSSCV